MWSNFHSHSQYCDGKGMLHEYLDAARTAGLISMGYSSHAPIPAISCKWCMKAELLPAYLQEIEALKALVADIEIYKGLEIDFIPGKVSTATYKHQLDYTIGSIHFVDAYDGNPWEIDGSYEVFRMGAKAFKDDIRAVIIRYYELTRQMILESPPDIVGHMDKIKIQNKPEAPFDESSPWYKAEVEKTLRLIKEAGIIVEVNTRGIYQKKTAFTYPGPWILEKIFQMGIPVTLSSDAHHKDHLICEFSTAAKLLKGIGFKNLSILKAGIWKAMPFDEYGIIS